MGKILPTEIKPPKPASKYTLHEIWKRDKYRRTHNMGMFDKDKEIGLQLTNEFERGQEFVLHGAAVDAEPINTEIGPARKTRLRVAKLDGNRQAGEPYEVGTLASAIADKAEEAEDADFPAVVKWLEVKSNYGGMATVLQFVKPYGGSAS